MRKIIFIFFVLHCIIVYTQEPTKYSYERVKFLQELRLELLPNPKHENEYTKFVEGQLTQTFLDRNKLSERQFVKMIQACNTMMEKRLHTYPELYNYVYSIYSLIEQKQKENSFDAYQNAIDKLVAGRNTGRITEFIASTISFFENRKLVGKSNFEWYYEQGNYELNYEDNKLFVVLEEGNLACRWLNASSVSDDPYRDSIVVYKTKGTYDFAGQRWIGEHGTVTWEKVGRPKEGTYAQINKYSVSMKSSRITFDSVKLKIPTFKEPIEGQLTETALNITREADRIFPQFISYQTNLTIENVLPDVNYQGGVTIRGNKLVGTSINNIFAKITVFKDEDIRMIVRGEEIHITDSSILANNATTSLYLRTGDSIHHPSVNVTYSDNGKVAELSRPNTGVGQAPFNDSYHRLDLYVAKIIDKYSEDKLIFAYEYGMSQQQKFARFESYNYLDHQLYEDLQGLSSVNPLISISRYCYKYDKYELSEGECATAMGWELRQAIPIMLQLASHGLINYDTKNKRVFVNQKLEYYVNGKSGKSDYDNIGIWCDFRPKELTGYTEEEIKANINLQKLKEEYRIENEKRNNYPYFGSLDLNSLDMELFGVDQITISQAQNAHIYPSDYRVVVQRNRKLVFSGWINVGKTEILTIRANYDYEHNKINILEAKELLLRVKPRHPSHGTKGITLINSISNPIGEIAIDLPSNRSGNRRDTVTNLYPILSVNNPTKVFYNSENFKIPYDSTRFYYLMQPFVIDSLVNFDDEAIRFKGDLVSAGIFPIISEELKVMPDYSFGFSTKAPKEGLNFYGKDVKYNYNILLSGNGLQGAGTIKFMQSTSTSNDLFTFFPDSTIGYVHFSNKAVETGMEFPSVVSGEAFMTYIPKEQLLKVQSTPRQDLIFFNNQTKLKGTAFLTPYGMTGKGLMNFDNASLISEHFVYKFKDIYADTASFSLSNLNRDKGENPLVFETDNVHSHVDFKERVGKFTSNRGESRVDFPVNQFMCKMDIFTWYMDKEELDMAKKAESEQELTLDTGVDLAHPNFFSLNPRQDSLQFKVPKAKLDIKGKIIHCQNVEYVHIADAWIYPDQGLLNIHRRARIEQLENATIVANYITKHHTFEHATVDILARKSYTGKGDYAYHDPNNQITYLTMNNIGLDPSFETIASGMISKEKDFQLSEQFDYYGMISLQASWPHIFFDGATRINHECDNFERNWLAFVSDIDPNNIQIPVGNSMKNLDGQAISAGIVWHDSKIVDSIKLYPTFLSALWNPKDPVVITSSGFLTYDAEHEAFEIASKEKLINRSEKGNLLSFNTKTCSMDGEGIVNLGMEHGDLSLQTAGKVDYIAETGETLFDLTAKISFPIDKDIINDVARAIDAVDVLKPMNFASNTLKMSLALWANQAEADKLEQDYVLHGGVKKLPKELESTMTFTGVRLKYYPGTRLNQIKGLITTLESAVLVNLGENAIMKYVPFKGFFQQKYSGAGGDWMAWLMDIPGADTYFFDYSMNKKDGTLNILTSDYNLVAAVTDLKEKKRKKKNFTYKIGKSGQRTIFNRLFETEIDEHAESEEVEEMQETNSENEQKEDE